MRKDQLRTSLLAVTRNTHRVAWTNPSVFLTILISGFFIIPAYATVTQTASGVSAKGVPVSFQVDLTILDDTLTVTLFNTSTVPSANPDDTLCSFFFDIVDGGNNRPTLTYVSAVGDVYLTDKSSPDVLQTANANLKAVNVGDNTWQFRTLDVSASPFLGFGVGTVGNANLSPNNFNGNIVDGMDYGIYAGDVTTQNLHDRLLVKDSITFTFSGLTGFTEANIMPTVAFGLGTKPDSLIWTPEPTTILLLALGSLPLLRRRR